MRLILDIYSAGLIGFSLHIVCHRQTHKNPIYAMEIGLSHKIYFQHLFYPCQNISGFIVARRTHTHTHIPLSLHFRKVKTETKTTTKKHAKIPWKNYAVVYLKYDKIELNIIYGSKLRFSKSVFVYAIMWR